MKLQLLFLAVTVSAVLATDKKEIEKEQQQQQQSPNFVDFNQKLLERSFDLQAAAAPALKYLNDAKLASDRKDLVDNLAEMSALVSEMRTDAFRERPLYQMETRLLANERAVIYEVRGALLKRSKALLEEAKKTSKKHSNYSRIHEQEMIIEDLQSKLSQEEDEVRYIPLIRLLGEHQNKLEVLLKAAKFA